MPKQNRQPRTWRRWRLPRWLVWRLSPEWRPPTLTALVVLFILTWWLLPPLLYCPKGTGHCRTGPEPEAQLKAVTDTRTALLAGLLGVAAILTFWLNTRGQMTDRYTKAIEQLGSDKLDVRLGGIYALEHIAVDSPSYHPTIVEVLSAFTRVHSHPVFRWRQHSAQFGRLEELSVEKERDEAEKHVRKFPLPDDVQAAVTVLGRLPPVSGSRGDLHEAYLAEAKLDGADLSGVNLKEADLSGAQLQGAHLEDAQLQGAHLQGAQLRGAHLEGAQLARVLVDSAQFQGAYLEGAQL